MELNKLIIIILTLIISSSAFSKLVEVSAKQNFKKICFISPDGKYTYYQRRNGQLNLATNYKVVSVIKEKPFTKFLILGSASNEKIIISADNSYHTLYNPIKKNKLYISDLGSLKVKEIDSGISPQFQLDNTWITYYDPYNRTIKFLSINQANFKFELKIYNKLNPYFIPQVIMLTNNEIIYTDTNNNGKMGVLHFNKDTNTTTPILKANNSYTKYELCVRHRDLFIGTFAKSKKTNGSKIVQYKVTGGELSNAKTIYHSPLSDIGNMWCGTDSEHLYFIRNTTKNLKERYELAEIPLAGDNKILNLSKLKYVTSFFMMNGIPIIK